MSISGFISLELARQRFLGLAAAIFAVLSTICNLCGLVRLVEPFCDTQCLNDIIKIKGEWKLPDGMNFFVAVMFECPS